ncbi:MAG: energy-coupling factor transporter transmembrane protein EcfT [Eubacterium sp.]|nr:energy-coupling factor transporter transmembrane protein EcfT [Eubacterium sp.]
MSEVTLGQYYPGNSIIHRLDPRVKLFATLVFIVLLFITNNIFGFGLLAIVLAATVIASEVPFVKLLKGIRGILFILIFSAIFNLFLTDGIILVHVGVFKITDQGIYRAVFIAVRLIFLVIGTSIMTLTTTPNNLADGLEKAFSFLKVIKFPVHEMAMMMSLALRFIPTLIEETDKIKKAQMARGADFESGNIFRRAKSLIPILIPLFISSIKRAVNLAQAMEARCYNGGNRTKLHPLQYKMRDAVGYICCFALIAVTIGLNISMEHLRLLLLTFM